MSTRRTRTIAAAGATLLAASVVGVVQTGTSGASTKPLARAVIQNAAGDELGTVTFVGRGRHATQVDVDLALPSTAPGLNDYHGFHVHQNGVCDGAGSFLSAGGHWDDGTHTHGAHLGDLPSVLVGADGTAALTADIPRFDVDELRGRSVILHAGRDNFGNVPTGPAADQYTANSGAAPDLTARTGNAGARYGCGVLDLVGR